MADKPLGPDTIQSLKPFTPSALKELEFWLEPWFLNRAKKGGNGLQYNIAETYGPHNVGDWLNVETTSENTDGRGMYFSAQNGGDLRMEVAGSGGGNLYLTSESLGTATLNSTYTEAAVTSGSASVRMDGATTALVNARGGAIFLTSLSGTTSSMIQMRVSAGNYVSIMDNTPIEQFRLTIGGTGTATVLQIADASGNLIFKVAANGDLHGKTGKALTFDL